MILLVNPSDNVLGTWSDGPRLTRSLGSGTPVLTKGINWSDPRQSNQFFTKELIGQTRDGQTN